MKKVLALLILTVLVLSLASCKEDKPVYTFCNLEEDFVLLSEAVVSSTLPEPRKTDEEFYKEITGKGVLFGDTESEISIVSVDGITAELTIDGVNLSFYAEGLEGAQIVDINANDNMHELAIYSAGPSMDPTINFMHFDGEKITPLSFIDENQIMSYVPYSMYGYHGGTENDAAPTYGAVYTNKQGKILHSMQYTGFADPRFALSYYELEGDTLKRKELSLDNPPVHFKIRDEIPVYFTPMEAAPESFENPILFNNFENPKVLQPGTEFTILDFGKCYNYYAFFIELDGETGVITFWTGD